MNNLIDIHVYEYLFININNNLILCIYDHGDCSIFQLHLFNVVDSFTLT